MKGWPHEQAVLGWRAVLRSDTEQKAATEEALFTALEDSARVSVESSAALKGSRNRARMAA